MGKLTMHDILKPGTDLKAVKLNEKDPELIKMIEDVKIQQAAILKLKEVTREGLELRMTI